ncbi:MAG: ATP-binding cassette domain-containing protein, partial [Burkholderiaceae bacterium]
MADQTPVAGVGLSARHLRKSYAGRRVVRDVSLDVTEGQVVGLLGPNGAGKTTSFYMLVGLVRCDGGAINLDGAAVHSPPLPLRARMG